MSGLSQISEMYEYSLNSFMSVFMNALSTSRKDNILQNRLRNIKDKLTMLVYDFTCMGIFEKHKLMFSFQMVTMIMDGAEELNRPELDFFLKGNTSLDAVERKKPGLGMYCRVVYFFGSRDNNFRNNKGAVRK